MRLLVTINGADAMIVGYAALNGVVNAIVIMNGTLCAVELEAIQLGRLPKPLRAKVKRRARKIAATENTAQAH